MRLIQQVGRHTAHLEIGTAGSVGYRVLIRHNEIAGFVFQSDKNHIVFHRVGNIDITNRALDFLHISRHTRIALTADTIHRPVHGIARTHITQKSRRLLGQIIGEHIGRTRAVGTMRHGDRQIRECGSGVQFHDGRIIPFGDGAAKYCGSGRAIQFQFARRHAGQIHDDSHRPHHGGHLHQTHFIQLLFFQRRVAASEIDGFGFDLLDPARGTDALIVHFIAGFGFIGFCPFGVHGVREGCARASDIDRNGARGCAYAQHQA